MLAPLSRFRSTHGLARFVTVVLMLTGLALIVGGIVAMGTGGSYRDAIAGAMWLIGFVPALYVAGDLWGEIFGWGLDEESQRVKTHWARPKWGLLPAGVVVMAFGTVVYML